LAVRGRKRPDAATQTVILSGVPFFNRLGWQPLRTVHEINLDIFLSGADKCTAMSAVYHM